MNRTTHGIVPPHPARAPSAPKQPPHVATVAQRRENPGALPALRTAPHPARAPSAPKQPPHAATVVQRRGGQIQLNRVNGIAQRMERAHAVDTSKSLQSYMLELARQTRGRGLHINPDDEEDRIVTKDERYLSFCFYFTEREPVPTEARAFYFNPQGYGSCLPFANCMAAALANKSGAISYSNDNERTFFRTLADDLYAAAGADEPYLYTVSHGIHGFSFVVRGGSIELIQVFAGPHGFSLAVSIQQNKVYHRDRLRDLLYDFANSQEELFGGKINGEAMYKTEYTRRKLGANPEAKLAALFKRRDKLYARAGLDDIPECKWHA